MNLLVVRNDKLGDFALIWPALKLLKSSIPNLRISALVSEYTSPLASICPYIDEVIVDISTDGKKLNPNLTEEQKKKFLKALKAHKFDASILFYSTWHNTKLIRKLDIPHRFAPATKLFQIFHNHRLIQRRSQNLKPEYEYNIDLAKYFINFLKKRGLSLHSNSESALLERALLPPYLSFSKEFLCSHKETILERLSLDRNLISDPWVMVHTSTGGTASTLSPHQVANLIQLINKDFKTQIFLTSGPNEAKTTLDILNILEPQIKNRVHYYESKYGLVDFVHTIACSNLFIAGSTGPLHIAGILDIPTIGFYPNFKSSNSLRWQVCSSEQNRMVISLNSEQGNDFSTLDMDKSYLKSKDFISRHLVLR
ncbi:RfaF protein [Taylorella asinigenitalis 14/45]|uniref:RfaF protein n=1 Tax=Taylorella asinigenitalis 14/45 TaxID=1091495 RepID=I7J0A6_9BURK|nr:glycosyltransferase family 9 protein [Taylorella asinigenitalis]CCG18855.1 RfaF protein [Taylorella asinigenitalis 14/45]